MKKLKLNLEQLSEQMELLDIDYLKGIKGGYGDEGGYGEYGDFAGYGGTPENPIDLDEVEITSGGTSGGFWGSSLPSWWGGTGSTGTGSGGTGGTGGYTGGYTGVSPEHQYYIEEKYMNMLNATGTTTMAFSGTFNDLHALSKLGDFAEDARVLLDSMGKYSGVVGDILELAITAIEMMEDGEVTRQEVVSYLTNEVMGAAIGSIPFCGGFLGIVYDVSGADTVVENAINDLITEHFG